MRQDMEFVKILTCALAFARSNLVNSGSDNSSNMCSTTSEMNLKSLVETNIVTFLIDPLGLRKKTCMVTAPQKGDMEIMSIQLNGYIAIRSYGSHII